MILSGLISGAIFWIKSLNDLKFADILVGNKARDIQKEFRIKKSFVSSLLTSLEEKKFIIRKQEGKKKRIIITKIGAKTIFSSFLTDKQIKKISEELNE